MYNQQLRLLKELYREFRTFNPFHLIEMKGIELEYPSFREENTKGLYHKAYGIQTIYINDTLEDNNARYFVAAHELYHALEHEDIVACYILNKRTRSSMEQEADIFAAIVCLNLYIEEHGIESMTNQDLEKLYGLPIELSELFF